MYSKAELFVMAAGQPKKIFFGNVTLSVPDDAGGCLNLDSEKVRLSTIWGVANMTLDQMAQSVGLTLALFAKGAGIPYSTMQHWVRGERESPVYVRFLLAEHYGLI